ncbi:MAG: hypothetical protein ABH827_06330, partial [bacterium]
SKGLINALCKRHRFGRVFDAKIAESYINLQNGLSMWHNLTMLWLKVPPYLNHFNQEAKLCAD